MVKFMNYKNGIYDFNDSLLPSHLGFSVCVPNGVSNQSFSGFIISKFYLYSLAEFTLQFLTCYFFDTMFFYFLPR